jgi:hypothetical protein
MKIIKSIKSKALVVLALPTLMFGASHGYNMMKEMGTVATELQQIVQLNTHLINATRSDIASYCKGKEDNCVVNDSIAVTITQDMLDLGFEMPDGSTATVGSSMDLPAGFVTFKVLPEADSFDYMVTLDVVKIDPSQTDVTEEFRWTKSGNLKTVTHKSGNDIEIITLKKGSDDKNILLADMTFTDTEAGATSIISAKLKMKQYNIATHGVEIKLSFSVSGADNKTFSMLAKADDNGGFVKNKFSGTSGGSSYIEEEEETFDGSGNSTGYRHREDMGAGFSSWTVEDAMEASDYDDINATSMTDGGVTVEVSTGLSALSNDQIRFMAVPHGEDATHDNMVAGGEFFDDNDNGTIDEGEIFFDFFGDESLLADEGATSDTDKLDIYRVVVNSSGKETLEGFSGIWLTK